MDFIGTILLVDNDPYQNNAMRCEFSWREYAVITTTSFGEARAMLRKSEPDLILMEAVLPDGDGFEFCQEIIAQFSPFIIFLTSKAERGDDLIGLRAGGNVYLTKPYHMPEFVARVEAAVKTRSRMGWLAHGKQ